MSDRAQYISGPINGEQFWSAHVNALEHHLSASRWALTALTVVVIAYPIARAVIPLVVHGMVPDVVKTVLNWV